ncbi:MAG TPA: RuBisCO large subunit C-terminal-like domain-containing protein, partial [Methanoregulaceae archaeon]|nr:RuBisCO large subunit C-terminal-like domain-containing protein [Methanoregulaceae archaeon]
AEQRTGERKSAFINITADTYTMEKRASLLAEYGWNYAMIDVVVAGTSAVSTLRDYCSDLGLAIHAHRAMHAAFDRDPKHGISMQFLAKLMRLIGVSQIHTGTAVGKLIGSKKEVRLLADVLRNSLTKPSGNILLEQDWGSLKSTFPVSSGGLHPGLVPDVLDIYGQDLVLLVSGGIHGHPDGTRAGAEATLQAIEAWKEGISLPEKAAGSKELARALEKWGSYQPK